MSPQIHVCTFRLFGNVQARKALPRESHDRCGTSPRSLTTGKAVNLLVAGVMGVSARCCLLPAPGDGGKPESVVQTLPSVGVVL